METVLSSQTAESLKTLKNGLNSEAEHGLISNGGDHHGLNGNGDCHDSSDDEVEEVKGELEKLQADALYHDFVLDVSLNRLKSAEDPTDEEFILDQELSKQGKELEDLDDSSSSSSEDSIYEDVAEHAEAGTEVLETESGVAVDENELEHEIEEEELALVDVKVPKKALKEAAARFPPFWKFNDHLRRANDEDYKSDEDLDYDPSHDLGMEQGIDVKVIDLVSSDSSSSEDENEEEIKEETDEISNLIEMIDDLAIPHNDVEIQDDEEEDEKAEVICLVQSIVEFDAEGYKSEEDPDFAPEENALEVDDSSDDEDKKSHHSHDDSSETEGMEE